jgi:mRNA-degrading endonuclease toxin of MazEF toxin-antitoxin module
VIVSSDRYHVERIDAIIVPPTSSAEDDRTGDYQLQNWQAAGLRRPSSIKATPYTVDRRGIRRHLGRFTSADAANVGRALRSVLGL